MSGTAPFAFASIGVPSGPGADGSSGSIVALPVPEPAPRPCSGSACSRSRGGAARKVDD